MLILATIVLLYLLLTTNWRSVSSVEKIKRKNLDKKSGNIKLVSAIVLTQCVVINGLLVEWSNIIRITKCA